MECAVVTFSIDCTAIASQLLLWNWQLLMESNLQRSTGGSGPGFSFACARLIERGDIRIDDITQRLLHGSIRRGITHATPQR